MLLKEIASRFSNLSKSRSLTYFLANPALDGEIARTEQLLGVSFPEQVNNFYRHFNGLRVDVPYLEIFPLERLSYATPERLHFATLDGSQHLYFDVSHINEAEQWDIVAADGFCLTLTMASFWSNRMWSWIEKQRAIWKEEAPA